MKRDLKFWQDKYKTVEDEVFRLTHYVRNKQWECEEPPRRFYKSRMVRLNPIFVYLFGDKEKFAPRKTFRYRCDKKYKNAVKKYLINVTLLAKKRRRIKMLKKKLPFYLERISACKV